MNLNDYSKEDLQILWEGVNNQRCAIVALTKGGNKVTNSDKKVIALLQFELDIEQAIKNKEFAEQLKSSDQKFEENTTLPPIK